MHLLLAVTGIMNAIRKRPLDALGNGFLRGLGHDAVLAALLGVRDAVAGIMDAVGQGALEGLGDELLDHLGHDAVVAVVLGVGLAEAGFGGGVLLGLEEWVC